MKKAKINNEGDPCRQCGKPVIKRISEFNEKKLKKSYFYTAYYWCSKCNALYMHDKFKIVNKKEWQSLKTIDKPVEKLAKSIRTRRNKKSTKVKPRGKEEYKKYLKSSHWKNRRKEFWETHRKICYCCDGVANQIHHCYYGNLGKEKDKDLVPICGSCHEYITEMVYRGEMQLRDAHEIYKKILLLQI